MLYPARTTEKKRSDIKRIVTAENAESAEDFQMMSVVSMTSGSLGAGAPGGEVA